MASTAQHAAAVQPHGEAAVGAQRLGSRLAQWPSSKKVAKMATPVVSGPVAAYPRPTRDARRPEMRTATGQTAIGGPANTYARRRHSQQQNRQWRERAEGGALGGAKAICRLSCILHTHWDYCRGQFYNSNKPTHDTWLYNLKIGPPEQPSARPHRDHRLMSVRARDPALLCAQPHARRALRIARSAR